MSSKNASICTKMKIKNILWLSRLKKNRHTLLPVIKINNIKMANILIKESLILNHILHRCIKYNPAYKIKQYFNYYEYNHVLVYCQKNTKYRAYLDSYKILEYLKIKCKNVHYAIILIHYKINNPSIEKKGISK